MPAGAHAFAITVSVTSAVSVLAIIPLTVASSTSVTNTYVQVHSEAEQTQGSECKRISIIREMRASVLAKCTEKEIST